MPKIMQKLGMVTLACWLTLLAASVQAQAVYVPSQITDIAGLRDSLYVRQQKPVVVSSFAQFAPPYHNNQGTPLMGIGTTSAIYTRRKVYCPYGAIWPRPVYTNYYTGSSGETVVANSITVSFAVEDSAGNIYHGLFNGVRNLVLDSKGPAIGDPIPIVVAAGGYFWERTLVQITPYSTNTALSDCQVYGYSAATEPGMLISYTPSTLDPATATTGASTSYFYGTQCWIGQQVTPGPAVYLAGDSIVAYANSYVYNALCTTTNAGVGGVGLSSTCLTGASFVHYNTQLGEGRSKIIPYATHAYIQLGVNDFRANGSSVAVLAQALIDNCTQMVQKCIAQGVKPVLQTITPVTTASNPISAFCDVIGNQTQQTNDAARQCYNDWIRGVPIATLNSTYSITLSAGTKPPAQLGVTNPYVEVADLFEVNTSNVATRNGSKWHLPSSTFYSGTATGGTTSTITGTGFPASNMLNMAVKFTSGANSGLYAFINGNSTTTSISLGTGQNAAGTTTALTAVASGDTFVVYDVYTQDGTHPRQGFGGANGNATIQTAGVLSASVFK